MAINLQSIVAGTRLKPPKVTIHGAAGVGKTTWAASAPSPIFLCAEEGLGRLPVARFEPRANDPVLRSWPELLECLQSLGTEDHDYETVVIDSLTAAESVLWSHVCKLHSKSGIEDFGYGKGYIYAVDAAHEMIDALDYLRNERGMAIVMIAHSEVKRFDSPVTEPYDRYQIRLQPRLAALIHEWSDAVLFAAWKTAVVRDTIKKSIDKERTRGVGRGERTLYTEERPAYLAKNRYGLPPELPLEWAAFEQAIADSAEPARKED